MSLVSCLSLLASESTSYLVLCTIHLAFRLKKKGYLFVALVLFLSFFFLFLLWSLGRRLLRRFLGIHSFSHLSGVLRV